MLRTRLRRHRLPSTVGPAFVAAIAYVDPGNVATNTAAGSRYGFLLIWVVIAANAAAVPVQYVSAKLGLATGLTLPQLCRARFPRWVTWTLWLSAELVTMATELAEMLGTALALGLLFGWPLLPSAVVGAAISFVVLTLAARGRRPFELAVGGMLVLVVLGFGYEALVAGLRPTDVASGLVPRLQGQGSLLLAVGIVGATIMPHAVFVHSSMTAGLGDAATARATLRDTRADVVVALGVAGIANLTMLAVAGVLARTGSAGGRAAGGTADGGDLPAVHHQLATTLGQGAATAFALALLVSGISSTSVGAYAGQVVMNGFTGWHLPRSVRRLVTMAPALAVLAAGTDATQTLVVSQVVLSFGIPFALVPLLVLSRDRVVMGPMANRRATTAAVGGLTAVVTGLNVLLLVLLAG